MAALLETINLVLPEPDHETSWNCPAKMICRVQLGPTEIQLPETIQDCLISATTVSLVTVLVASNVSCQPVTVMTE